MDDLFFQMAIDALMDVGLTRDEAEEQVLEFIDYNFCGDE